MRPQIREVEVVQIVVQQLLLVLVVLESLLFVIYQLHKKALVEQYPPLVDIGIIPSLVAVPILHDIMMLISSSNINKR